MIDKKKRAMAVARILSGASTAASESSRLNINIRTVEKWVAAAKSEVEQPEKAGPGIATPPLETPKTAPGEPQSKPNPALQAALDAAGEKSGSAENTQIIGKVEQAEARADLATYCIEQINQMKVAIGSTLVAVRYSPPLSAFDARVQAALKLGPIGEGAVRANAATLYPILTRMFEGKALLFGALAWDTIISFMVLHGMAVTAGWKAPEKKPGQASAEAYAEQLKPKPFTPPPPAAPPDVKPPPSEKAEASIVDAPHPEGSE